MASPYTTLTGQRRLRVESARHLTPSTYLVRLHREDMVFTPGQCVLLGFPGEGQHREYSIYSAQEDLCLEVLVKEVMGGNVSCRLKQCQAGECLEVEGPVGFFTLPDADVAGAPVVFVASGTGISPFHCMVKSYPDLNYTLIHGVRTHADAYEREAYPAERYVLCTSRDSSGDFEGRVSAYLQSAALVPGATYYLCGNSAMIDDVYDVLANRGVDADNIRAEVYF